MVMPILRITHISWVCGNGSCQVSTSSSRSATGIKSREHTKKSSKALMGHTLVDVKMPASCISIVSKMHSNGLKRHQLRNRIRMLEFPASLFLYNTKKLLLLKLKNELKMIRKSASIHLVV